MKDFEELEGIADQMNEEIVIADDEDDGTFRPTNASTLTSQDLYYEVHQTILCTIYMFEKCSAITLINF